MIKVFKWTVVLSAPVKTIPSVFTAFIYAVLPVLLRVSSAVMATKSRHVAEVMATVQISVVAEEEKGRDPFLALGLYNVNHLKSHGG